MVHATIYKTMKWKYSVVIINSKARTLISPATVVLIHHCKAYNSRYCLYCYNSSYSLSENIPQFRPQQKSCSWTMVKITASLSTINKTKYQTSKNPEKILDLHSIKNALIFLFSIKLTKDDRGSKVNLLFIYPCLASNFVSEYTREQMASSKKSPPCSPKRTA